MTMRDRFLALGRRLTTAFALSGLLLLSSCSGNDGGHPTAPTPVASRAPRTAPDAGIAAAIAVQEAASGAWFELPGVLGTGVGRDSRGQPVIVVLLEHGTASGLPASSGGIRLVREILGPVRPFALTQRYRPVPIGVSAGNALECVPGTIGCVLESRGKHFVLSANHVLARQNQASVGEVIAQPSLPDADPSCGSSPRMNMVARLADFEPVIYDGHTPNTMDAAIAELTEDFSCATPAAFYGLPSNQPASPTPGLGVLKVGRTTELTRGTIKAINVKVKITFPSGTALFVGQVLTSKGFGAFGDSGSLVATDDGVFHPIGIVIGGGSNGTAIVSPIAPILERFDATVCDR